MMIWHIGMRELRSMFLSPLAWSILAVVQLILAYMFLGHVDLYLRLQPRLAMMENAPGLTEVIAAPLFGNAAIVLLLVVPMLTMRLISEERRGQTLPLLFSAPVSMTEIILGKYLGVMLFLSMIVSLTALMPLSLVFGADIDLGMLAAGVIGLTLLVGSFAAAGLFMSTLTSVPAVAAVSTFGLLLLLWILDFAGKISDGGSSQLFSWISIWRHYEPLLSGHFKSSDIIYYLLFIGVFITLSIRRLDADRLQH